VGSSHVAGDSGPRYGRGSECCCLLRVVLFAPRARVCVYRARRPVRPTVATNKSSVSFMFTRTSQSLLSHPNAPLPMARISKQYKARMQRRTKKVENMGSTRRVSALRPSSCP